MSKSKLAYQVAGGIIGLVSLNLALAPSASASGKSTNMSHATGTNMSHATGGNMSHGTGSCDNKGQCGNMSHGSGGNMSHGSGGNMSHGSGKPPIDCGQLCGPKPGEDPKPVKNPFENGSTTSGSTATGGGSYVIGKNNFSQFDGGGKGGSNYGASSTGLSRQMMELLNAASNAYSEASARLAAIQSQSAPAKKDDSVRYSRVADANADCGCNASASAPDNSVELAAAQKAEAEAAASLAKAQQQAREFLEAQKKAGNNLANGTQFTPIW